RIALALSSIALLDVLCIRLVSPRSHLFGVSKTATIFVVAPPVVDPPLVDPSTCPNPVYVVWRPPPLFHKPRFALASWGYRLQGRGWPPRVKSSALVIANLRR